MAFPVLPAAAGAAALFFLLSKSQKAAAVPVPGTPSSSTTTSSTNPYSQAPSDGSRPSTTEPKPPAKTWKEMPQSLQEQVAAALGALGVSPATGELGPDPVSADAIKLATQTAALCESQGFYDVAKELNRLAGLAAKKVPTPKEAEPIKQAAPPGLTAAQIEAIARTLTLDRDPKSIEALLKMLQTLPPSPQRDDFIQMASALLLQLAAAQSTTQTMQQIDQVIKSPGIAEVNQAVQPLPPATIPVVTPSPTSSAPVPPQPTELLPVQQQAQKVGALLFGLVQSNGGNLTKAKAAFKSKAANVEEVKKFQRLIGAPSVDGLPGPSTFVALAKNGYTRLPNVYYWAKASTANDVLSYRAALGVIAEQLTAAGNTPGANELRMVAAAERGQGGLGSGGLAPAAGTTTAPTSTAPSAPASTAPTTKVPAQPKPAPAGLSLDQFPDPSPKARLLKKGMSGDDVRSWQRILIAMGYPMGSTGPNKDGVDGSFGPTADRQTRAFQAWALARYKDSRIVVDGQVGPITRRLVLMRTAEAKAAQAA